MESWELGVRQNILLYLQLLTPLMIVFIGRTLFLTNNGVEENALLMHKKSLELHCKELEEHLHENLL